MYTLVTGATGTIGNAVARHLVDAGHRVRVLVRDRARAAAVLPEEVELTVGDITEPSTLPGAVDGVEVVFHAAGLPEQWFRDPAIFDRVNHLGTVNVLRAAQDGGVERVVHTSTMDVFAAGPDGSLREDRLDPEPKHTHYERSKQAADRAVQRVIDDGFDIVHTNPGSVYGPSPSNVGANQFFIRLCNGDAPLLPPGGMSVAEVDAVAAAHLAAAERGGTGERYLLADRYATMRELAEVTQQVAGLPKLPRVAPAWLLKTVANVSAPLARTFGFKPLIAPGELEFLLWEAKVDSSKAQRELGYEPVPLLEGVTRTIAHLRGAGLIA
jgi:nucleoside-diphosphate-sugar epimerase